MGGMFLYFSCFFKQKAYLESRFRSSEPVTKEHLVRLVQIWREAWSPRVLVLQPLTFSGIHHRQVYNLGQTDKLVLRAWSSLMVMGEEVRVLCGKRACSFKGCSRRWSVFTCLLLECCRWGYSHEFLEGVTVPGGLHIPRRLPFRDEDDGDRGSKEDFLLTLTSTEPALTTGKTADKRLACSPLSANLGLSWVLLMITRIIIKFTLKNVWMVFSVHSSVKR